MNSVNNILIRKDQYRDESEFLDAVRDIIMLLLDAGYIMTTRYEEKGLGYVSISFDWDDPALGGPYPYWLTPEQYELIECYEVLDNNEVVKSSVLVQQNG